MAVLKEPGLQSFAFELPDEVVLELGQVQPAFLTDKQRTSVYADFVKRWLDLVLCSVALTACLPVFCLIALLIRLDTPGPIFFRQSRRGLNGKSFEILKFRTMTHGTANQSWTTRPDDERITTIGKLLRDYKVDELPQIFNILRGDMSIVGPRPLSEDESFQIELLGFPPDYPGFLHRVRPGLIGLEQVNRQEKLEYQERFDANRTYAERLSWQLDWHIFCVSLLQCRLVCSLAAISALAEVALLTTSQ